MIKIKNLLCHGYFAKELPPPFNSKGYGEVLDRNHLWLPSKFEKSEKSKLAVHNLARSSGLRRKLSIPNPVTFYNLADFVTGEWNNLVSKTNKSRISCTSPVVGSERRALISKHGLDEKPLFAAKLRSKSKYILQADIARFYPSIYTHSIPWAIHTKSVAKRNYSNDLIGNKLDKLVRNMNDNQTLRIPIGPDISLLIAELILSDVDDKLFHKGIKNGFRYIDDYEFAFTTLSEAETTLGYLQEFLNDYVARFMRSFTLFVSRHRLHYTMNLSTKEIIDG